MVIKMNVPKLRFKEFTNEWSYDSLNNFIERIMRKNKNNESNLVLTISAQYGLVDQCKFFNRNVSSSNLTGYYLLYKGDFAYNKSYSKGYPWGAIKRLNRYETGVVSSLYICFSCKNNINQKFLEQYFETNKWHQQISEISVEGARNHGLLNISIDDFFNTKHFFPNLLEQNKIANFLTLLDKKIELQSQKIEALKLYKLCILKYIFSSATIKTKLKSIGNIKKGEQINSEELSKSGSYYMLNGGTEPSGYLEKYNTLENTITISEGGNSCGYVKYNKCKFWCGGHCYSIENKMIDNHYLYQLLKFNENKIMRLRIGSGLPNIQKKDLENFELSIHEKNDQHKIAKLLIKFDTKIELEQDLLNLLLNLKKGLMQNMFV